jgi:hypothetical protein
MKKRFSITAIAVALALVVAACSDDSSETPRRRCRKRRSI